MKNGNYIGRIANVEKSKYLSLNMVTKISEVKDIVVNGISNPKSVFSKIKEMATSDDWKVREVAATILVEISKKRSDDVIKEMIQWAENIDSNIRRTSSEGLRHIARHKPEKVLIVIERLKADSNLYVKKSVANILRNAGKKNSKLVLDLCRGWTDFKNKDTNWIIKDGLRKLKESQSKEVDEILDLCHDK